ncbi:MAG: tetratricopeptide repeat protein [Verrucomicrobiae bacterium]|nr:tetratricopeptide repeat protein [Verrucomicrobiae bacterium]
MIRNSFSLPLAVLIAFATATPGPAQEKKPEPEKRDGAPPKPPSLTEKELEDLPTTDGEKKAPEGDDFFKKGTLASLTETKIDGALLDPAKVQELIDRVQPGIVKITHLSRDGDVLGTGSGFILTADGYVATNHHVIGTARPIKVETIDGTEYDVTEVHAWDRHFDLAILKIDSKGRKLTALELGKPEDVIQGQAVLGFGNPRGLTFSVVSGIISAVRKIDEDIPVEGETPDFPMIQLGMPIELGSSGGPVVDLQGRVLGLVTIKHMVTPNLGFAVPAEHLQPLLDKPNPVPMERWMTIGALDPSIWTTLMGARWTQHGGVITAEGLGSGFGGRALCLSERTLPTEKDYEISVKVKLDDEGGAAGLAFESDGGDKHYGFYPSGGGVRLTRFEGPDLTNWTILQQIETEAYRPGEWNHLRVRITPERITGFVNGERVIDLEETVLRGGQAGLCKFRRTVADFRQFRIGENLSDTEIPADLLTRLNGEIDAFNSANVERAPDSVIEKFTGDPEVSRRLLLQRAEELEARAAALRRLNGDLHEEAISRDLAGILGRPPAEIDLFLAGLHVARLDNPEIDLDYYQEAFGQLAAEAKKAVEASGAKSDREKTLKLARFLFDESGFHGARSEYYHPANSYLSEVLDYREGLPITLSVMFIELARRLGVEGVHGVPLPGHFLVGQREDAAEPEQLLIDVFEGGKIIDRREAENIAWNITRTFPSDDDFAATSPRDIFIRMLRNLSGLEINGGNPAGARRYVDLILSLSPEESMERFQRALLRYQDGDPLGAKEDVDWLLEHRPLGIDYRRMEEFQQRLLFEIGRGK